MNLFAKILEDKDSIKRNIVYLLSLWLDMSSSYKYTIPKVQRALVLQGGGALGSYQAGVFKSLYEKMKTNQNNDDGNDHHLFDIIAGTSIGAINDILIHLRIRSR